MHEEYQSIGECNIPYIIENKYLTELHGIGLDLGIDLIWAFYQILSIIQCPYMV
jgi:hypothetical protein